MSIIQLLDLENGKAEWMSEATEQGMCTVEEGERGVEREGGSWKEISQTIHSGR